ncbi:MAG: (2Fe-2S)-binding protein [Bacteroidetes bacterium]|nr:(2Fe-2S)-binding protein [Bacteroidota bacterium]
MASITFVLNGKRTTVDVDSDTPLLWVLRDTLGLTATKYGCGEGICGSCTVLMDGEATRSCVTPVQLAEEKTIVTLEGLGAERLHALQEAWIEEEVPQCGYCQPGQIMTAAALLQANPKPSDKEIDEMMSSVLCRCGTYPRIKRAIKRAAQGGGQ